MKYFVYFLFGVFTLFLGLKIWYLKNLPKKISKFILPYYTHLINEEYSIREINIRIVSDYIKLSRKHIMKTAIKRKRYEELEMLNEMDNGLNFESNEGAFDYILFIETGVDKRDKEIYLKKYKSFYQEAMKYGFDVVDNPFDMYGILKHSLRSRKK